MMVSAEHRVDDLLLELGVVLQHEAEDGGEDRDQREHRQERVVRHQCRVAARAVDAEPLDGMHERVRHRPLAADGDDPSVFGPGRAIGRG